MSITPVQFSSISWSLASTPLQRILPDGTATVGCKLTASPAPPVSAPTLTGSFRLGNPVAGDRPSAQTITLSSVTVVAVITAGISGPFQPVGDPVEFTFPAAAAGGGGGGGGGGQNVTSGVERVTVGRCAKLWSGVTVAEALPLGKWNSGGGGAVAAAAGNGSSDVVFSGLDGSGGSCRSVCGGGSELEVLAVVNGYTASQCGMYKVKEQAILVMGGLFRYFWNSLPAAVAQCCIILAGQGRPLFLMCDTDARRSIAYTWSSSLALATGSGGSTPGGTGAGALGGTADGISLAAGSTQQVITVQSAPVGVVLSAAPVEELIAATELDSVSATLPNNAASDHVASAEESWPVQLAGC
eukprot:gene9010-9183_t